MYNCQGNDDSNIYNSNNNVYSYSTSSGPSAIFTTFELLFLVSTVTLGKPLLSIKKYKTKDSFFSVFFLLYNCRKVLITSCHKPTIIHKIILVFMGNSTLRKKFILFFKSVLLVFSQNFQFGRNIRH